MSFYPCPVPLPEKVIYRHISIGLDAFDRLKQWQRHIEQKEGRRDIGQSDLVHPGTDHHRHTPEEGMKWRCRRLRD